MVVLIQILLLLPMCKCKAACVFGVCVGGGGGSLPCDAVLKTYSQF